MSVGPDSSDLGPPGVAIGAASQGFARILQTVTGYGFAKSYQAAGDQTIYEGNEPYRLALFPESVPRLAPRRMFLQPSRLLRPQYEIVPFSGRETEMRMLQKWRDSGPAETMVMLLHGQGGQGKTRLASHISRKWIDEGWLVLRAFGHDDRSYPEVIEIPWTDKNAGVLVVADYAERWATTDLLTLLRDTAAPAGVPVRVILLSRSAGSWWQTLAYRLDRDLDVETDAIKLLPLGDTAGDRQELFTAARDRFAELLNVPDSEDIPPPLTLDVDRNYGSVLTVHMSALAAVLGRMQGDNPPYKPVELSAFLLARERESWQTLYEHRRVTATPSAIAQTVYTATLTGPLNRPDGLAALRCADVESILHPGQLIKDHAVCYPSQNTGMVLEPLYPDRLGEDFLALVTPGHNDSTYPADPWAQDALIRLLTAESSDPVWLQPTWVDSALNTLTEVASRWPHIAALTGVGSLVSGRHRRPGVLFLI